MSSLRLAVVAGTAVMAAVAALTTAPIAHATYASGGVGEHRDAIRWIEWGDRYDGQPVPTSSQVVTDVIGGRELVTQCFLGGRDPGVLKRYRAAGKMWSAFDELHHVAGAPSRQIVAGLFKDRNPALAEFTVECEMTLDGVPVPVPGLVVADAEQSQTNDATNLHEYFTVAVDDGPSHGAPGSGDDAVSWHVIDRYRDADCPFTSTLELASDNTMTFDGTSLNAACASGPIAVVAMAGASSATLTLAGYTAVAVGVLMPSYDEGGAPGYAPAGALLPPTLSGGEIEVGVLTAVSGEAPGAPDYFELGSLGEPSPRLGPTAGTDDGITVPALAEVRPGDAYVVPDVACTGPGHVAGWLDWNADGTFEAGERSEPVPCTGTAVDLTWTVPDDVRSSLGADATYLRIRIGPDPDPSPIGVTASGEVEDFPVEVRAHRVTATQSVLPASGAPIRAGEVGTFTSTFHNPDVVAAPVEYVLDLTGVLDDADLTAAPVAFGGLTVGEVGEVGGASGTFAVTGTLAAGQSATVDFTVVVRPDAMQGDGILRSLVLPRGAAASPCLDESPWCASLATVPTAPPPASPGPGAVDGTGSGTGAAGAGTAGSGHGDATVDDSQDVRGASSALLAGASGAGAMNGAVNRLPATGAHTGPLALVAVLLLLAGVAAVRHARRASRSGLDSHQVGRRLSCGGGCSGMGVPSAS